MEQELEADRLTRGHRKKERTRRLLLDAGLRVLGDRGESLTARDVTNEAGVAVGTFYNYFIDTDGLIDAVMRDQLLAMAAQTASEPISDPALRIAVTATRILDRAANDAPWARLVLRLVGRPGEPNHLNGQLRDDLIEGRASGRFRRGADDATLDQAAGLVVMTIRRIVAGEASPDIVGRTVACLLEGIGVPDGEASDLAAVAPSLVVDLNPAQHAGADQ